MGLKILYGIQGTGNGHVSRARDIVPELMKYGQVDILISGSQADVSLPYPITYKLKGLGFVFGKKGGVDLWETFKKAQTRKFYKEIQSLPVQDYDLVISDFEPVTSWACSLHKKACIGLSHQAAVLHDKAPKPDVTDIVGRLVLKHYAPVTKAYGFHFQAYDERIFTPVIRQQIRELPAENLGHYTVYLPAYEDDRLIKHLSRFPNIRWEVFSKHNRKAVRVQNLHIQPINNEAFIRSLATCEGILCGAGFETPAEALFLKKKVLVIPMKNQYEQHCNAAAAAALGVPVIKSLKKKHYQALHDWLASDQRVEVHYPDQTADIIRRVVEENVGI